MRTGQPLDLLNKSPRRAYLVIAEKPAHPKSEHYRPRGDQRIGQLPPIPAVDPRRAVLATRTHALLRPHPSINTHPRPTNTNAFDHHAGQMRHQIRKITRRRSWSG